MEENNNSQVTVTVSKKNALISSLGLIILIASFFFVRAFCKPDTPVPVGNATSSRTKVNYKSDIDFLTCVGSQHTCIYDHIKNGEVEFILEDCKDENYCNNLK